MWHLVNLGWVGGNISDERRNRVGKDILALLHKMRFISHHTGKQFPL